MDARRPDDDIIQELLLLATTDTTDPPEWALDLELRKLEGTIIHTDGDLARFVGICREARERSNDPHVRGLFLLGVLNGTRRMEPTPVDEVSAIVRQANEEFGALPPGKRTARLFNFLDFQLSIHLAKVGDYALARETHEKTAAREDRIGNHAGTAISRFMAKREAVNEALVAGTVDPNLLAELVLAGRSLAILIPEDSPEFVRWVHFNGPVHRLVAHFLAGDVSSSTNHGDGEHLCELFKLDFAFVKQNEGIYFLALAIQAYGRGDYSCSYALARATLMTANTPAEYYVVTYILLAELALERDDEETAKAELTTALAISQPGGHQARAVAARILASFETSPT